MARVERFLVKHADSSLFLRSNMREAGLADEGKRLQGTWVAAVEQGEVIAVACHVTNGNVLLQAPVFAAELARESVARSGRPVKGIVGPWEQVVAARAALGLANVPAVPPEFDLPENLYALSLENLIVPDGQWECSVVAPATFDAVVIHRADYVVEAIGEARSEKTLPEAIAAITRAMAERSYYALTVDGQVKASGCFNARLPDVVQLGGIYTPPAERGRGHARRLVAGMLRDARAQGVTRAVLFTGSDNLAAQRAYEAIGFRQIGRHGLVLWNG